MEIKPLKSKIPQYPSLEEFISHSNLLGKSIPKKWLNNKIVTGALTAFLLSGNSHAGDKMSNNEKIEYAFDAKMTDKSTEKNNAQQQQKKEVKVAPIFVHGIGYGVTGCIVMSTPVFISEEEARKVIFEAFEKENIVFDTINTQTIKFQAKPIANYWHYTDSDREINMFAELEIKLDAYNEKNNLSVEYISLSDYLKFRSEPDSGIISTSSVEEIDIRQAADTVRYNLILKGQSNSVVFYDPMVYIILNNENEHRTIKKKLLLKNPKNYY